MSLGLELDFLAVIGLVKQIRKSFTGAPEQFKAISEDVRGFSIVLQDIEANCTELSPEQSQEYQSVVTSCKHLLVRLRRTLEEYSGVAKSDKPGKRTAVKRVWKRLKWEPDDIRDIRSQISVKIGTLRSLNDQVTSHNIVKLIRHQEDTEREATIEWVSEINYVAQQNDIFLRCQTGSRRWLFESEIYLEWLRRKGSLLFCPGHPGTGKTFTAAMVIESLRLANDADTLTAYMYCSYQNHTLTIEKLLCSLLRAALEEANREADGTISTCKQLRLSNKLMSRQHCLSLLQDLLSRFTRVNLIVDALDELTNEVRRPLIYDLLKLHDNSNVSLFVTSRGNPEIQHLFESSEVYTSLEVRSSDEDIRNFLSDNIFQLPKFVDRSPELRDEVIESVTNASAGMFLLAELYLKSLASVIPLGNFRIRLSTLSTGSDAYDTLYKDSMLRIRSQGPESERIAVQMLLVLTCARRPLSPQELSHALSIDESSETFDKDMVPDMDDLVAVCAGLVRLDDTSNIVHLVHKSAAEYFERKDIRSRWFPMAHMKMASMCLRYIQIAEKKPEETRGEQAPFLHYAKANWNYHFMNGEEEAEKEAAAGNPLQLSSATDSGALQNTSLISRLAIQQMFKEVVDVHSAIVEACYAGHRAWVEQLLVVRNYDINKCGISQESFISEDGYLRDNSSPNMSSRDGVLLTIAAARGDCNMAQMLLARGADPNIFNTNGQTPLIIAVMNNFDNMVSLLLDQKLIKPDLMCRHSGGLSTAFLVSIELGGERCFGRLFERSNHRTRDSFKRGAMWLAASSGHTGIISQLLESHSIEVDYDDTDFCGSPLIAAARGEHEEAALLLLPYSKGQSCSHCGISPMYYAVRNGFHNLLERLLEKDASEAVSGLYIDPRKKQGRRQGFLIDCKRDIAEYTKIPLLTAIYLQDMKATQLLLSYAHDKHLYSQLIHEVSEWDNAELFQLLLKQENVKPDSVDEDGKTPFPLAAKHGYCDIMDMLIKPGDLQNDRRVADGNATEDHRIANSNYAYCFRLLASVADRDINEKDLTGSSLLHQACRLRPKIETDRSGSEFVADFLETNTGLLVTVLLMRPGVNVNLLDGEGETPLLIAVKNHQRDVVRLLLEQEDTNVLAQDGDGNDALLLASIYEPMFEQLFPWRASSMNHDLPPLRGQVPTRYRVDHWPEVLNAEFKEYDESIFSMLIHDKRTNPYRRNFQGDSVINRVVMTGTKSMIQALAETTELASELEIIYPDGKSVLSLALQKNQDDGAVDLLIAHCSAAVLRKADAIGRTPLSYAVQRATSQATRSLLAADVDINAADSFGLTPLSYATDKRYIDAACLLIAVDKTQVNLSDRGGGLTPLMHAIFDTNIPLLSALLDRSDIDVMATDKEGHSLLCYLLESHFFRDMCERELEKELESVINRIHHRLQLRARVIHSPFICALESDNALRGIYDLQRFAILLEFFHTGLEFSRCATTAGLLEILDEDNRGACSDDRDLGLRALRLFTNRGT